MRLPGDQSSASWAAVGCISSFCSDRKGHRKWRPSKLGDKARPFSSTPLSRGLSSLAMGKAQVTFTHGRGRQGQTGATAASWWGGAVLEPPERLARALLLECSALPSLLFLPSCGEQCGSRIRSRLVDCSLSFALRTKVAPGRVEMWVVKACGLWRHTVAYGDTLRPPANIPPILQGHSKTLE